MIRPRPMAQKIRHYQQLYQLGALPGCLYLHGDAKRRVLALAHMPPLLGEWEEGRRWARDKVLSAYRIPAILVRGYDARAFDDLLDAFNYALAGLPKHEGLPVVGYVGVDHAAIPVCIDPNMPDGVIVFEPQSRSKLH